MRILFILPTFYPDYVGGAEISALHTCRELVQQGVQVSLLVVSNRHTGQTRDDSFDSNGLQIHRVSIATTSRTAWNDVFDWRVFQVVRFELARVRPDLVHVHNVSGATLAPFVACRVSRVKVVCTLHDLWLLCPNNMAYRRDGTLCDVKNAYGGCRKCYRRYDYWGDIPLRRLIFAAFTANAVHFISPSRSLINQHVQAGFGFRRFRYVANGVALPPRYPLDNDGNCEFNYLPAKGARIVYSGGGIETKGAGVLTRALPIMLRHIEDLEVFVAGGESGFFDPLRSISHHIRVLGNVPNDQLRALMATADLTLVPSVWYENSPIVIYESFQVGTPVVGSNIGGIPELIDDAETGYLFQVGDAASLAEKVIYHFSRPPSERRRMRLRCVQVSRTKFSMENHVMGIMRVYRDTLVP